MVNDNLTIGTGRILIISNRLPIQVSRQDGDFEYRPSVGGLATSLRNLQSDVEMLWVGWPGVNIRKKQHQHEISNHLQERFGCTPLFPQKAQFDRFYSGFSNACLWPLFHYFPQYARFDSIDWDAYTKVNQAFHRKIVDLALPNDTLWIHDYHLMLLPSMIRESLPDATIGFFLHIPFPSFEIFRVLPWREEILHGLLGADLIGFHSFGYVRHFLSSLLRLLGLEHQFGRVAYRDRAIKVDTFPLGVDVERFSTASDDPKIRAELSDLEHETGDRKVILSVDRLDFTKGIPECLEAYEAFLEKYPEWQGEVTLIALCVPSRLRVPTYRSLKRRIDELVGRINGHFAQPGWTPIWYLYRSLDFQQLMPLYQRADVALVTPLRDGMNLVAKEYLASHPDGKGVLILSETAGAAEELGEALIVNPHNKDELVKTIHQALTMPESMQKIRNRPMLNRLERYDTVHWAKDFLDQLETAGQERSILAHTRLSQVQQKNLLQDYCQSQNRVLFLDYDGTLVPFARQPEGAQPDSALLKLLQSLAADPKNAVVIISGRDRTTLDAWLGTTNLHLIAEHGAQYRYANGRQWYAMGADVSMDWKDELRSLLETYVVRTPGAILEEKKNALAWHYRKAEPEMGSLRANELLDALEGFIANTPLHILHGSKVVEITHSNFNKGKAIQSWLASHQRPDFILAIGDDVTDEDMFAVLPEHGWSLKVGRGQQTEARFYLPSTTSVRQLLNRFANTNS